MIPFCTNVVEEGVIFGTFLFFWSSFLFVCLFFFFCFFFLWAAFLIKLFHLCSLDMR